MYISADFKGPLSDDLSWDVRAKKYPRELDYAVFRFKTKEGGDIALFTTSAEVLDALAFAASSASQELRMIREARLKEVQNVAKGE